MNSPASLLDELRVQYEAVQESTDDHGHVESFEAIDARLRKAFRWLEKAITYLNGLKPPIDHRFDLGYGFVFDSPRFAHGSVGQHERHIVGFPVLEAIDVYYEVSGAKPLSIEVAPGGLSNLYGSSAMAGVINVITRRPQARTLSARGQGGNRGSVEGDLLEMVAAFLA